MSVHLFVRSCYTLLGSTVRMDQLVKTCKKLGYGALALTDHNVMHGMPYFLELCSKEGIKPIAGLEADVAYHDQTVPFLLLAQDAKGYLNLLKMSSILGEKKEPLTTENFRDLSSHCFVIAYGEGGYIDSELVNDDREGILNKLKVMKAELPPFDMALSYQEASLWKNRNAVLKRIAASLNIHSAAINKIYYLEEKDAETLRLLNAIRTDRTFADANLLNIPGRHFLSQEEMSALYESEELERTDEIAAQCSGNYELEKTGLPPYPLKEGITSGQYLEALCFAGLKKRLHQEYHKEYADRLRYELKVIEEMHFEDYFLIVYDFILYARRHNIYVGPGRGSAAGSLTAYCLGITEIDPLKYNLLFERFLNPERISMPDIDTDFPDNRRDEVKEYVYHKYGADHVAEIVTFSTIGARQAIMDTARALNLNKRDQQTVMRLMPRDQGGRKTTLAKAYQENARLREVIQSEDKFKQLYRLAASLEGLPRNYSVHAAGMILSSKKLTDIIPLMHLEGNEIHVSQYTAGYLEERGLIKIDFLGLRNLTIISEIVDEIHKENPDFAILKIPLNDPKTYQVFQQGNTTGIFQFEGEGMRSLLKRMKPDRIEDIAAALALYRPGPMANINTYLDNRKNPQNIVYPLPSLEPILKETYGVIVYQEQIMLIAEAAAGFTLGKADTLRKAISKKKIDDMRAMRTDFINGCMHNGISEKDASDLFSLIEKFAGYGFNKSHAIAYSYVAYQLAYLKAEYPLAFYCALLNSVIGDETKTAQYVSECRRRSIRISGPDINLSTIRYQDDNNEIRLPLSAIHGIGNAAGQTIVNEREENGAYTDFYDFVARMSAVKIDRKKMEMMIDAGALDSFGMGRRSLLYAMDEALQYGELVAVKDGNKIRLNLDLVSKPVMMRLKDVEEDKSEREKEALGFNIGTPPIVILKEKYHIQVPTLAELKDMRGMVRGCASIRKIKRIRTKKGDPMAFVTLNDETGELDMTVMPRQYAQYQQLLAPGNMIVFDGRQDDRSLIVDHMREIRRN